MFDRRGVHQPSGETFEALNDIKTILSDEMSIDFCVAPSNKVIFPASINIQRKVHQPLISKEDSVRVKHRNDFENNKFS